MDFDIRPAKVQDYPAILRLNEADVEMLSPMDEEILCRMAELTELFQVCSYKPEIRDRNGRWP